MESRRLLVPVFPFWLLLGVELLLLLLVHTAFSRPFSVPERLGFQALDVAASLREAESAPTYGRETKPRRTAWSVPVVHRESFFVNSAANTTASVASFERRLEEKLMREAARVRGLEERIERRLGLKKDSAGSYVAEVTAEFGGEVVSGMEEGSGEYFTRIGVGTPTREQYMVLDTGSNVVWIQCQPCQECYSQSDPIFNPTSSASFSTVGCGSAVCSQLGGGGYDCDGSSCPYRVTYGDGSSSVGSFATETLTFGSTSVLNVAIGCGHDNVGLFVGAAGLLGLGAGPLSFPTQLGTQTGRAFSYCLVDRKSESFGTLEFGPESVPVKSIFMPLQTNPFLPSYYYLSLSAISVGGALLDSLPPDVFRIDETSGRGGVIIDSGTVVTRLQTPVYDALRDAFVAGTRQLPRADGFSIFDTCYDLWGLQTVSVPQLGFHFSNGATLILPANNYLIPVDLTGTFCLAFAPATSDLSIIVNIQQQGIRVSFDSANSVIGFGFGQC